MINHGYIKIPRLTDKSLTGRAISVLEYICENVRVNTARETELGVEEIGEMLTTRSPLDNGLPPDAPWEEHMKRDLAILATCDGIYLQTGWEKSKGCRIEVNTALTLPQIRIIIKETIKTPKTNKTTRCAAKVT